MKTITLTQGKVALVDDDLFDELNQFKWNAYRKDKTFYAKRDIRLTDDSRAKCRMHHEVFRLLGKEILNTVDHKDRNGLNNRYHNLRPATTAEQGRNHGMRIDNKSGYIGVSWCRQRSKWWARVCVNNIRKSLGYFDDPVTAAKIRDEYVLKHHGEFAVLNFPPLA